MYGSCSGVLLRGDDCGRHIRGVHHDDLHDDLDAPPATALPVGLLGEPDPEVLTTRGPVFLVVSCALGLVLPILLGDMGGALALAVLPVFFLVYLGPHLPRTAWRWAGALAYPVLLICLAAS